MMILRVDDSLVRRLQVVLHDVGTRDAIDLGIELETAYQKGLKLKRRMQQSEAVRAAIIDLIEKRESEI